MTGRQVPAVLSRAMLARLWPLAIVAVVAAISVVSLVNHPATASSPARADHVVLAGAPGLRWDDLSAQATPALWQLAAQGSVGTLSTRSAAHLTCPSDGWLTMGAGNLAEWGIDKNTDPCAPVSATVERLDGIGGRVTQAPLVVDHNRKLAWGAQPGALAEAVRCTAAIGTGAALAAARPVGRVDRYVATAPADLRPLLAECPLTIIDLGTVSGSGAERAVSVAQVDTLAARVLAARLDGSLVIVAGLADTQYPSRLHVLIADGPGLAGGWLTSASTGRAGYAQLFDLAPTVLAALDEPAPSRLFAGQPLVRAGDHPAALADTAGQLSDADGQSRAQRDVAGGFFLALAALQVLVLLAAAPLLRRARHGGPRGPRPMPARIRQLAEVGLAAVGLAVPAALAADLIPWWRSSHPGLVFAIVWLAVLAPMTACVLAPLVRARTLGSTAAAAGLAALVVVVDTMGGGRLQLNGVGGYSAADGMRYVGVGAIGLGTFLGGLFLTAGCAAQYLQRSWRPVAVSVLGCGGITVVGSPYFGSDAAGAIALTAGVCVAVVMATGRWLTTRRLATALAGGAAVMAAFALLDLGRPLPQRGSLGQFLTSVHDGTAGLAVQRTGVANVVSVATSPLTLLALAAGTFVFFVLLRPWGGLRRLYGLYPALRAGCTGLVVAAVLGGLLNGAGFVVAGAAAATAVPLLTLAALRALAHADDRTLAAETADTDAPDAPALATDTLATDTAATSTAVLP